MTKPKAETEHTEEPELVDETPVGPLILRLMPKVFERLGAIGKDHTNPQQHYAFRSIDDVVNKVAPILIEHHISQETTVRDHRTTVATKKQPNRPDQMQYHAALILSVTFIAPDGSRLTKEAAGEGIDYGGDKATNKAMAAAYKYAIGIGGPVPFVQLEEGDYGPKEPQHEQPPPSPQRRQVKPRDERVDEVSDEEVGQFWVRWKEHRQTTSARHDKPSAYAWVSEVLGRKIDEATFWLFTGAQWDRTDFLACQQHLREERGEP